MKRLLLIISLLMTLSSYAEISDTLIEGKSLASIAIVAAHTPRSRNLSDSLLVVRMRSANLGQLMEQRGWANVTSYGPKGMLSTARVNGSMSDHTTIYWNNLSLNNPALGLADLSLIPVSFFNKIKFTQLEQQQGIGQGAMAASIALQKTPTNSQFELSTGINSLNNSFIYGAWSGERKGWNWSSQFQRESNKNEFSYRDTYRLKAPTVKQKNNNAMQSAFMQELGWRSKNARNRFQFSFWILDKKMNIPDLMGISSYYRAAQSDFIQRFSFLFAHVLTSKKALINGSKVELSMATSREFQRYTNQLFVSNEYSVFSEIDALTVQKRVGWSNTSYNKRWAFSTEVRHTDVKVENTNYTGGSRREPFVALNAIASWSLVANRVFLKPFYYQEWRTNLKSDPSYGASLHLYLGAKRWWRVEMAAAKKFRVADFNERFWTPGGNPNLLPEDGEQYHVLSEHTLIKRTNQFLQLSMRASLLDMKQLIQWVPQEVWTPVNLNNASIASLDGEIKWSKEAGNWLWSMEGRAKWIKSNTTTALLYTPTYSTFAGADLAYKRWDIGYQYRFIAERSTSSSTASNASLPAYDLHDVYIGWKSSTVRPVWSCRISIENIADVRYESVRAYAMPGRVIGIQLNLYPLNIKRTQ